VVLGVPSHRITHRCGHALTLLPRFPRTAPPPGRSGSGKSTLLISLLRIADPSSGDILIDGVDITHIGLSDLRSRIAVIPQEPVLLTGTIRSNLDPFHAVQDEGIWRALRAVHLAERVGEMPLKLETPVSENGRAFSLPERQLFCIARAILIDSRIVIFDGMCGGAGAAGAAVVREPECVGGCGLY
jgi:ABC-type multidrug transport system fused ATPase/permease subunit